MNNQTSTPGASRAIYLTVTAIILIPILFIIVGKIQTEADYSRLKTEIDRVESVSGISPASVDCSSGTLASVCTVTYETMKFSKTKSMLTTAGYEFGGTLGNNYTGKNANTKTSVGFGDSDDSRPTVVRFKDIEVTL